MPRQARVPASSGLCWRSPYGGRARPGSWDCLEQRLQMKGFSCFQESPFAAHNFAGGARLKDRKALTLDLPVCAAVPEPQQRTGPFLRVAHSPKQIALSFVQVRPRPLHAGVASRARAAQEDLRTQGVQVWTVAVARTTVPRRGGHVHQADLEEEADLQRKRRPSLVSLR